MSLRISDTLILQYAENVLSGQQIASVKVIKACQRFITDLEQEGHREYPWRFDLDKALRPIEFMERFLRPTKGEYDRMELQPWQQFIEGNVYGWVDKASGLRRFRESLLLVGRGNGKSTLIGGNGTFGASKDGERGADVYLLANSKEQASIVFDECKKQIIGSPLLSRHFRPRQYTIYFDPTNSKIEHRASDSKRLDGLNPHMMVFDEVHAFRDYKLINVMRRAMKKRAQPLVWYISTMGDVLDGPLMDLYNLADDVLNGITPQHVADRFFAFVAEIDETDEPEDVSCWQKANPALGSFLSLQETVSDWERARLNPRERSDFINKQLNVFTDTGAMGFVEHEIVRRNDKTIALSELEGRTCYAGFDASLREDFTAAALLFPLDDGRFAVLQHSWIPERKVNLDNEKLPYREWAEQGLLTIVPGEYVRQQMILEWLEVMRQRYIIRSIGYDPANASWLIESLKARGVECNVVIQGWKTLNDPMKEIKELLIDGRIIHNNNPLFCWYLGNVKLRKQQGDTDHENWVPTKQGRYRKIDGFMAWLDAHTEYRRANPVQGQRREPSIQFLQLTKGG